MKGNASMLEGYRCLDLCGEQGFYCGKLLGDMGADVIKVEAPSGDPSRMRGPFYGNERCPDKSLSWLAFNVNKRGISLNIETEEGQDIFRKLVSTADIVIESFPPGYLDRYDLGYDGLKKVNPKIILTSITPFGQNGPYRDYKTSDLVSMSMGGITWLIGDPDRPPVTVGAPQAFLFAGQYASIGSLLALHHREMGGRGQHVDISIQQSVLPVTLNTIPHWTLNHNLVKRAGNRRSGLTSGAPQRQTWRCKDGYVTLTIYGGARGVKPNRALVRWLDEEGMAPDYLKAKDWAAFDVGKVTLEEWEAIERPIAQFFLKHTRAALFDGAIERHIMLFPVYHYSDLLLDRQLAAREFWATVEYPGLGTIVYPGAFGKCSETPLAMRRPAPAVGEHNVEIYRDELGITDSELRELERNKVI
jgi:crotonobetainyl-CoA:carnitine CoA-transferase CaiB-like acyl-CoA transferase